jgi:steroid delta-isomerase-like uncharacterized protein
MTEQERNKEVVRRIYEDLINKQNLSLVDELFAENAVENARYGAGGGREGFRQLFVELYESFSDYQVVIEDIFAADDKVVARHVSHGTHDGDFMGIAPTMNKIEQPSIDIMRLENGQVAEHWGIWDLAVLLKQLDARELP